jgi:hypothetical protein
MVPNMGCSSFVGLESQFKKIPNWKSQFLNSYDATSIMHYGESAFSKDGSSKTMISKFGLPITNPYDKPGMDESDIFRVNKLYHC